jgi:hypothetical protein
MMKIVVHHEAGRRFDALAERLEASRSALRHALDRAAGKEAVAA